MKKVFLAKHEMKNYVRIFVVLTVFTLLMQGCYISFGTKLGYNILSDQQKEKVVFLNQEDNICEMKRATKVYAITGKQLLKCIEDNENVMVYLWRRGCTGRGEFCFPPSYVQEYCDKNNITLYLIAYYYNDEMFYVNLAKPVFTINHKFYKTDNLEKLFKQFFTELLNSEEMTEKLSKESSHASYLFKNGKLVSYDIKMEDEDAGKMQELKLNNNKKVEEGKE